MVMSLYALSLDVLTNLSLKYVFYLFIYSVCMYLSSLMSLLCFVETLYLYVCIHYGYLFWIC